jgi:hypothetical protein
MHIKFLEFINESIINSGIEINRLDDISIDQELQNYLINNGMRSDDVDLFNKYNDNKKVSVFELIIPWNLDLDFTTILSKGKLSVIKLDDYGVIGFYWIDMGNGLTSIAEEGKSKYSAGSDSYTIYSGEKRLNKFLEEELEILFNTEKYNL